MKKFKLEISTPCHEDFNKMQANAQGFFCNQCAKSVIDLSNKSDYEISRIISSTKDKNNICVRMLPSQMAKSYELFEQPKDNSSLKYASAIAASVLLSTSVVGQEKVETKTEVPQAQILKEGQELANEMFESIKGTTAVSFTLKGKLLDAQTGLIFSKKEKIKIQVMSLDNKFVDAQYNRKTGEFELRTTHRPENIHLMIVTQLEGYTNDEQAIVFDANAIKDGIYKIDLTFDKRMNNAYILGGPMYKAVDDQIDAKY